MTKVVFLDFDGVLNTPDTTADAVQLYQYLTSNKVSDAREQFDNAMIGGEFVKRVQTICDATGAVVVVSSSWRILHDLAELDYFLITKDLQAPVIDMTPRVPSRYRGHEIDQWLSEHPEVDGFVILDDGSDMDPHSDHLVQTDFEEGLQDRHVQRAIEVLGIDYKRTERIPEE